MNKKEMQKMQGELDRILVKIELGDDYGDDHFTERDLYTLILEAIEAGCTLKIAKLPAITSKKLV